MTEPRYQLAIRDRETGEVNVTDAACVLTCELTPMPDGGEHHSVQMFGVRGDAKVIVRLLAILVRNLARTMRVDDLDLALETARDVVRVRTRARYTDPYTHDFGRKPPETPDA